MSNLIFLAVFLILFSWWFFTSFYNYYEKLRRVTCYYYFALQYLISLNLNKWLFGCLCDRYMTFQIPLFLLPLQNGNVRMILNLTKCNIVGDTAIPRNLHWMIPRKYKNSKFEISRLWLHSCDWLSSTLLVQCVIHSKSSNHNELNPRNCYCWHNCTNTAQLLNHNKRTCCFKVRWWVPTSCWAQRYSPRAKKQR